MEGSEGKNENEKLYYGIREVAELFNVKTSLIRYWEKEFPTLSPKKNRKGDRYFTQKDIDTIHLIHHLLKERGFTIKGARKKLRENKEDTARNFEVVKKLQRVRSILKEMRDGMDKGS